MTRDQVAAMAGRLLRRRPLTVVTLVGFVSLWRMAAGGSIRVAILIVAASAVLRVIARAPSGGTTAAGRRWMEWADAGYPEWPDVVADDEAKTLPAHGWVKPTLADRVAWMRPAALPSRPEPVPVEGAESPVVAEVG